MNYGSTTLLLEIEAALKERDDLINKLEKRVEELEKENNRLEEELRCEIDARGNDYFAYLDMKKYAYRVGHKDECFTREKRVAELEGVLREIDNRLTIAAVPCFCNDIYACFPCITKKALRGTVEVEE
jgi:hypothetical protein